MSDPGEAGETYALTTRSVECTHCGAPVSVPFEGGPVDCSYCNTEFTVVKRRVEQRAPTTIDEASRLAGLHSQQAGDPASLITALPTDLTQFETMLDSPETAAAGMEALRQAWLKLTQAPATGDDRLGRVGLALAEAYALSGQHPQARAVLETALDRLVDADHRDIFRCRLARAAAQLGEAEAAQAWLEQADPRPLRLEVDSELRIARATLALTRREADQVGELLGDDIPIVLTQQMAAHMLRAAALLAANQRTAAIGLVHRAVMQRGGLARAKRLWPSIPGTEEGLVDAAMQRNTRQLVGCVALVVGIAVLFIVVLAGALHC